MDLEVILDHSLDPLGGGLTVMTSTQSPLQLLVVLSFCLLSSLLSPYLCSLSDCSSSLLFPLDLVLVPSLVGLVSVVSLLCFACVVFG